MSDIQQDPIQPGQAYAPQKDNTGLKVVVIVLIVLFGFPLILAIAVFIFVSANFDKITEWLDEHIDDYEDSYSVVSNAEIAASAQNFYDAVNDESVKVAKDDCQNIRSIFGYSNSSAWLMNDVCAEGKIEVGAKDNGETKSLFFSHDACLEVIFNKDFTKYLSYNYNGFVNSCDVEKKTIRLEAGDDDFFDDEDDDKLETKEAVQRG